MAKRPEATPRKMSKKDQAERFAQTAREIEADETGEAFERAFRRIVPPVKTLLKKD